MQIDYLLHITDADEELVQARLFLTNSTGNDTTGFGVTAYFESAAERDEAAALFEQATKEDRPRTDWLELYQQSLKPLFIGEKFVVAPEARLIPPDSGRHELVIPQSHAFGTGSHESTALCMELLETIDIKGKRALDIGAGSGILALAMLQLGAKHAIAFDVDLDAYAALRENPANNRLQLPAFIGTLDALRPSRFDVITMNILPEIIVPLLPQVKEHLGGLLIVSGILRQYRDDVAPLMRVVAERTKGEWWAAILST